MRQKHMPVFPPSPPPFLPQTRPQNARLEYQLFIFIFALIICGDLVHGQNLAQLRDKAQMLASAIGSYLAILLRVLTS